MIIQDEFHLISGPLGTMVGLYETAVDELSSWKIGEKTIRPKIIASTATVRKAGEQTNNVFLRQVSVFPPHGLDVEDNFFSVQRPIEDKPGRLYMGICSPGNSRPAVLIRVYVALLTAAQSLFERFGIAADPYMTLVGYFNSLRELGGMRRLAEDDVQTRSYRVQMSDVTRPGLAQRSVSIVDELTSRVSSKDIPNKLDQLEVKFKSSWNKGETRAIDIILATNMLSVGVDINRLGLMVVNGQPKSTAEYIQATSRVGRVFPGLVCTVLTWARPRDLSHYETFEHYHATFYKHVEAQSVTPFAPRALDRGLMGTMVSLLRLGSDDLNPNVGAQKLDDTSRADIDYTRKTISDRAWKVKNKATKKNTEDMVDNRIDLWVKEATKPGRLLGYETKRRKGEMAALLKRPGILAWDEFTVPTSMREVEPGVNLIMDISKVTDSPNWKPRAPEDGDGGAVMTKYRVGQIRPSQLLWTYGPGALVDLPNLSAITMGLDRWDKDRCPSVEEERLLSAVRRVLGSQVTHLRIPPYIPDENVDPLSAEANVGTPVRPFPRWFRCVKCGLLAEFDSDLFKIKENRFRPENTHFIHANCERGSKADAVPARFLLACRNGHLDDFPWHWFVHGGPSDCKGTLRFFESGASLQTENLWVKCDACDRSRSLVHAFGREGKNNLPACRGRHPHLDRFDPECNEQARPVLLGATNSWFPITLSVLAIPIGSDPIIQVVTDGWKYFEDVESVEETGYVLKTLKKSGTLPGVQVCEPVATWQVIQDKREGKIDQSALTEEDLKRPEWDILTSSSPPSDWPQFLSRKVEIPKELRKNSGRCPASRTTEGSEGTDRVYPCGSPRRRYG